MDGASSCVDIKICSSPFSSEPGKPFGIAGASPTVLTTGLGFRGTTRGKRGARRTGMRCDGSIKTGSSSQQGGSTRYVVRRREMRARRRRKEEVLHADRAFVGTKIENVQPHDDHCD